MNYAMKKDRNLKHAAIKIFGPIIKNAWIAIYANESKSMQREIIKGLSKDVVGLNGDIIIGTENVVIEFTTGKRVLFWWSEWGGIKPMGKEYVDIDA